MRSLILNGAGLAASAVFVFSVIAGAGKLHQRGVSDASTARKLIHIALAQWWLIAVSMFDDPWVACAGPACSLLAASLMPGLALLPAKDGAGHVRDRGTICYSAALLILVNLSWRGLIPVRAAAAGVLVMGWGDGIAGLVGMRWGGKGVNIWGRRKTAAGTAAMFLSSFIVCLIVTELWNPRGAGFAWAVGTSLATAGVATALELLTPLGIDNLTISLGTSLFYAGVFA